MNTEKENLVSVFQDTMERCKSNAELNAAVKKSLKDQYIVRDGTELLLKEHTHTAHCEIVVSRRRTIEAAEQFKNKKVCVLNFASSKNPGGGVVKGAKAQEECICRITTLYPCLSDENIMNGFYLPHRTMFSDTLYNDDLIFTPDVICFKTDTASPVLRPDDEWFKVNVITCASPNLGAYTKVSDGELEKIQYKRLERVFITAVNEGADVLILGAFGCGAFRNPPKVVAKVMKQLTDKYSRYFSVIEFAVYCSPKNTRNYDAFREIFGG